MWVALLSLLPLAAADEKALELYERANIAYEALEYDEVLSLLDQSLAIEPDSERLRIAIHELRATMFVLFDQSAQAQGAFTAILALDPTYTPPLDASPKIREAFQSARLASATGELTVQLEEPTPWYRHWAVWTVASALVLGGTAWLALDPPVRRPQRDLTIELQ